MSGEEIIETHDENHRSKAQNISLLIGIILYPTILILGSFTQVDFTIIAMATTAMLMAFFWISAALPLAATSLIPLVAYPLLGISSGKQVASVYANHLIFLFLGGFMIALSMEKWNLHKRIALNIIAIFGKKPSYLIWGFMAATAFLSMWISNTATTIMMVAIVLSIIKKLEEGNSNPENIKMFSLAMLLGVAYAASIGGMATLVGTPPNLVFSQIYHQMFPQLPTISFGNWMVFALPLTLILLTTFGLLLTKVFFKVDKLQGLNHHVIVEEKKLLPPMSYEEKVIAFVFTLTAFLWMFRKSLTIGTVTIPGWSALLPNPKLIDDGTVAIAMALILFMIPSRSTKRQENILTTKIFYHVPWSTLLLFGGGFALAMGFKSSGLSDLVGQSLSGLKGTPSFIFITAITTLITFLTELTSNTATTQMILPILGSLAEAVQLHPLYLMVPATLAASCAFMLPVATPPNAIIFGSGKIKVSEMVKVGIWLNLISMVIISIFTYFVLPWTLL